MKTQQILSAKVSYDYIEYEVNEVGNSYVLPRYASIKTNPLWALLPENYKDLPVYEAIGHLLKQQ